MDHDKSPTMIVTGLDLETTGLSQADGHRIMEIAATIYRFDPISGTASKVGAYVQRINPERAVDPKALAVHGITFDEVSGCPTFEEVAGKAVAIFAKSNLVVAHNGEDFDMPFIAGELIRVGQPIPDVQVFDTMKNGRWATAMGKYPNLGELCFSLNVPYDPSKAHGAEYDCDVMMECFFRAYRKGFYKPPMNVMKGSL